MSQISTQSTVTHRFGIEEEYFISDAARREACRRMPDGFLREARESLPSIVETELLQTQIEVATPPCVAPEEARAHLVEARGTLGRIAGRHGLMLFAAGTHPTALWSRQQPTQSRRYAKMMRDLAMVGSRNLICGMHVHVEVADPDQRIRLMTRMIPYLPLLLALSTSSPFWQGRRTGLSSYRLSANRELPRSGLPEDFADKADYDSFVSTMIASGAIADASHIWWLIRPAVEHPTLELRVCDSATNLDHVVAIASLYRCLVRLLERRADIHARITAITRAIAVENIWRAQRYGVHGSLICERTNSAITVVEALEQVLGLVGDDARVLGCEAEFSTLRQIATGGSSADHQLALFNDARGRGRPVNEALGDVIGWLAAMTAGEATLAPVAGSMQDGNPSMQALLAGSRVPAYAPVNGSI